MLKMTPGNRRIPAVPGCQGPRADLVEARGSVPRRILRRQRTLSVRPSPAFPIPWKVFLWKVFPWIPGKFPPGEFSPGKFSPEMVSPGKFSPGKFLTLFWQVKPELRDP
jgi:hypothetical protein